MKYRLKIWISLLVLVGLISSCKEFLDVDPLDRLGDSNFWQNKGDVEAAIADDYGFIFKLLTTNPFQLAAGEFRAGVLDWSAHSQETQCFIAVGENDLDNKTRMGDPSRYNMLGLSDWYPFYQSIANCNNSIERIPEVENLTDEEIKQYVAEVRFIRAYSYFFISRLYGDVPLYTEAFDATARARTPMLDVMKFIIGECEEIKDDLPWQYDDPSKVGVRAARGSVYALLANANMWAAGFDHSNEKGYWQAAADAVDQIIESGRFDLYPIEQFNDLFRGRTVESLFEFEVNEEFGTATKYVSTGQWMVHTPIIDYPYSWGRYDVKYMEEIFPKNQSDRRRDLWFYLPYDDNNQTMFLKFSNVSDPQDWFFDDNLIIFRYGGILLLGAEALANLNRDDQAIELLNKVRSRAGASLYNSSDGSLKDFIFHERQRELIGEGHQWYDLVRTGRVMNSNDTKNSLTQNQFEEGGWTWPIDPKARINNPKIILNSYWDE